MIIRVRIVSEPIDTGALIDEVAVSGDGAVASFTGRVRDHHGGRGVQRLEYHTYAEMAREELERIARDLAGRYQVGGICLVHRSGELVVGETSVAVAVAAPHRRAALDCCAAAIEAIKTRVPIWKKEFFTSGEPRWIFGPDEARAAVATVPGEGKSGD